MNEQPTVSEYTRLATSSDKRNPDTACASSNTVKHRLKVT